jgi:2-amino-4-hydroxy-6-hydroxymethyldihydropteridine diphosphokinase
MAEKRVYAALGSNLGERPENLRKALELLKEGGDVRVLRVSGTVETKPLGGLGQPDYLNAVAEVVTSLGARELLGRFGAVENKLGRVRGEKWASRPIDIDLLLYGDEAINEEGLLVPHPRMHLRSFVMQGMKELAPDTVHPVLGETMMTLAERLCGGDFSIDALREQLISVAGVIGVGKTTLAEGLAAEFGCKVIREAYDTNPFLARVYAGEKGLALDSQIYFLTSRVEQLDKANLRAGVPAVSDYIFDQEGIYAAKWLDKMQLELYGKVNRCMARQVCEPVVAIFLHDTAANCLSRIKQRGRSYEQKMDIRFLEGLRHGHEAMFGKWTKCPILRVDAAVTDCRNSEHVRRLAEQIRAYISA